MRRKVKNKYKGIRKEFKKDLFSLCLQNDVMPVMIIKTYSAYRHREHIMDIMKMMNKEEHESFRDEYSMSLFGKRLTGEDEIFHSLYFANRDIFIKYNTKIPSSLAMGDALSVAYAAMNKNNFVNLEIKEGMNRYFELVCDEYGIFYRQSETSKDIYRILKTSKTDKLKELINQIRPVRKVVLDKRQ